MNTLTKKQQEQLNNLKRNGSLYVGYNSRTIMNIFDKLVDKGYAKVIETSTYGKRYTTKN